MGRSLSNSLREFVRCTRHNLLHLRNFRLSYKNGLWQVRDGDITLTFPQYPYLAFYEIEGYLFQGRWRPEPGMTVVDAGGCFGEFSLYASKCVGPNGRVLMLEPDPANVAIAKELFKLNANPSNIEIVSAGLWSRPGRLRFNADLGGESAIASFANPAQQPVSSIEIDTHTLATLVQTYDLKRLDFVKMDIEGAELEVVSTASELPPEYKPRYSIASYHVVNGRRTADVLEGMFPKLGYHCRSGCPNHLTTWASPTPLE